MNNTKQVETNDSNVLQVTNQENQQILVNISELPGWIYQRVKDGESPLLLRPNSLKTLYQLFFYEHMRWRLATAANEVSNNESQKEVQVPDSDSEINLPEQLVLVIIQVYFNQKCFNFFNTLSNL